MIRQISIFAENKIGAMMHMTDALIGQGINMYSLITNDSAEFGIVRILVDDPEGAMEALQKAGYLCHMDKVIAMEISDEPGSLNRVLKDIHYGNINLDYLYVTNSSRVETALAVLHAPEIDQVEQLLTARGYRVLD
ncbi:MAG: amino acid-binding protein [bacterium]|nr:amino acid-binding protein [Lachnospiraceae bacterium]